MWWPWLLISLVVGIAGGWGYATFVLGRATGRLLVDIAVHRALIKALLGVYGPYHDDPKVAAVVKYVQGALERLDQCGAKSEK